MDIIGLVPTCGLLVVFIVVFLATVAVPLPSSMLVLAAGRFVASGDLVLWEVFAVTFLAFTLAYQTAAHIARRIGPPFVDRLRARPGLTAMVASCERYLNANGKLAVLASRTILSPLGPYVSDVSGAGGMGCGTFSVAAIAGAALWTLTYVALSHVSAMQLTQQSVVASYAIGIVLAGSVAVGCALWLRGKWRFHSAGLTPDRDARRGTGRAFTAGLRASVV